MKAKKKKRRKISSILLIAEKGLIKDFNQLGSVDNVSISN